MCAFIAVGLILWDACFLYAQAPDTLWTQRFVYPESDDVGRNVVQTFDGGFIISTSLRYGTSFNPSDAILIKTDAEGDTIWTQNYNINPNPGNHLTRVRQTNDGGYVTVGYTGQDFFIHDGLIIKTDAQGNEVWHTVVTQPGLQGLFSDVVQLPDGGYAAAGYCGWSVMWLVRFDALGRPLWRYTYSIQELDYAMAMVRTQDGGFALVGTTGFPFSGTADVYLVKTDSLGTLQWQQMYGTDTDNEYGESLEQTPDGGYIIAGSFLTDSGGWDGYTLKVDAQGQEQWSRIYGTVGENESFYDVLLTWSGDFIFAGRWGDYWPSPMSDFWLLRTNPQGQAQWQSIFGWEGTNEDIFNIEYVSDGSFIAVGQTATNDTNGDIYLLRFEGDVPLPQMTADLNPLGGPIVIPPGGGSFACRLYIANTDTALVTFDAWIETVLPNGILYGPLIIRRYQNLAPGFSLIRNITQQVPAGAPAGQYLYRLKVGFYPMVIFAQDSFTFTKSGADGEFFSGDWDLIGWDETTPILSFTRLPFALALFEASPNPYNSSTVISFELPVSSLARLGVYDISGRRVAELVNGWREAGVYEVNFDGSGLATGVYIYRLETGKFQKAGKILILK